MELILASTSRYRKALLGRLGLPFRSVDPRVDEDLWKARIPAMTPRELAEELAIAKAQAVASQHPDDVVIGGDQLVAFDGQVIGKPGTVEAAEAQLRMMSGRGHQLLTAIAVISPTNTKRVIDVATLTFRSLTDEAIRRYVAADYPIDCAGSYKLEERGIALFERIEAADHSAITGIPLIALTSILIELGFAVP